MLEKQQRSSLHEKLTLNINVSGSGTEVTIKKDAAVNLSISGSGNRIHVDRNTFVRYILLSGSGNGLYLSDEHRPIIQTTGSGNTISYE